MQYGENINSVALAHDPFCRSFHFKTSTHPPNFPFSLMRGWSLLFPLSYYYSYFGCYCFNEIIQKHINCQYVSIHWCCLPFTESIELYSFTVGEHTPFIKYMKVFELSEGCKKPLSWLNASQPPPGLTKSQQYQIILEMDLGLHSEDFKMVFRTRLGGKWWVKHMPTSYLSCWFDKSWVLCVYNWSLFFDISFSNYVHLIILIYINSMFLNERIPLKIIYIVLLRNVRLDVDDYYLIIIYQCVYFQICYEPIFILCELFLCVCVSLLQ